MTAAGVAPLSTSVRMSFFYAYFGREKGVLVFPLFATVINAISPLIVAATPCGRQVLPRLVAREPLGLAKANSRFWGKYRNAFFENFDFGVQNLRRPPGPAAVCGVVHAE